MKQEPQGALSRSPVKHVTCSFAQNCINFWPIIWIIHDKTIVFLK